jgi:hypothetical protein
MPRITVDQAGTEKGLFTSWPKLAPIILDFIAAVLSDTPA